MTPERWQQIEKLFHSVAGRRTVERAAFLDRACSGDEALRAEVERLLASHDEAGSFINAPAFQVAAGMIADEGTAGSLGQTIGQTIGHYKLRSLIGAGGMGEVYLASDTRMNRDVALKLLLGYLTKDAQRVARFQQEARAVLTLNHPNIVTIYEIGEADGVQFIAGELIEGQTLRSWLTHPKLKLSETLDIAIQVASALAAAHQKGVVHRDIKPENIMLRPDGYVKVLDFGIAKLTEREAPATSTEAPPIVQVKTHLGMVMGTAQYMSPEQARGLIVDARTDIWSLGVVLYEMIARRAPFEGATTSDVISAILEKQPPPLARYEPDAPSQIQWIVTKALRKDKDERYQTMKEMLSDLKDLKQELDTQTRIHGNAAPELSSGTTVSAGGAGAKSSAEYLVGEIKRHRRGGAIALAVLVIAIAATAYFFYFARVNKTEIHSIAILPFTNVGAAPDAEYLSDGLTESLINSLSKLPNLRVTARTTAFSFKGRSVDPRQAGRELGVDALLTGRVTQRGDTLTIQVDLISVSDGSQLWGEQYQRKLSDVLAVQGEIAREISAKMRLRLTGEEEQRLSERYTENVEAYQLYLQGRYFWNKVTEEAVKKSEGYFKQAIEKDPNYALAYAGLADTYILSSFIAMASPAESYGKAKVAATKALEIDNKLGDAHATLALILTWYEWNWPAGEAEFKRALELSPNSATAHQGYGRALTIVGRFDEALAELRRAHDLDPLSIIIDADLESVFFFSRRYDESINQNRKILEMEPRFVFAYIDLSTALEQTGKPQEAITELQKALSLENENPFVLSLMGFDYARMGAKEKAQDMIKKLTELSRRKYVSPMLIARVYAGLGNRDQAFELLEQGYQGRDYNLPYLRVDQTFDSLRSDPRFSVLVRRIGLP